MRTIWTLLNFDHVDHPGEMVNKERGWTSKDVMLGPCLSIVWHQIYYLIWCWGHTKCQRDDREGNLEGRGWSKGLDCDNPKRVEFTGKEITSGIDFRVEATTEFFPFPGKNLLRVKGWSSSCRLGWQRSGPLLSFPAVRLWISCGSHSCGNFPIKWFNKTVNIKGKGDPFAINWSIDR